mgnify:FL=1
MNAALHWLANYLLIGLVFSFGTYLWVSFKKSAAEQHDRKERLLNF